MNPAFFNLRKNSEHSSLFLFVVILLLVSLSACQPGAPAATQLVFSGPMMGTQYRITVIKGRDQNDLHLEKNILDSMNSVNQSMSNYLPESELSQFNQLPANQPQILSQGFAEVMSEALKLSELTNGAFDVTLGSAVDAWGFGPQGQIDRTPSSTEIEQLKQTIGYEKLVFDGRELSKTVIGVELNLSAIAKGYAVDSVAARLESLGFERYLINIGGELRASGKSIDNQTWRVGIEKPHILGGVQEIVRLDNTSIATSGDYRNYLVIDGQQFSHMIDSQTLTPILHKLALASVISERASTADALATGLMAMDESRAWKFAQDQGLAAYLIVRGELPGEYQVRITEKFRAYLQ
jgi:thiamine biosynthesis lipoprotein